MERQQYLAQWATKLSLTTEQIENEFKNLLEDEKKIHKDLPVEQQEARALKRLSLVYKKQMRSPAVGYEGIVVGVGDCVDVIAKQRKTANELFKADPQKAVSEGVTDEIGNPLVTRKEWPDGRLNSSFGKPLPEHNYIRNIWVFAKKSNTTDNLSFYQMLISGERAMNDEDVPIFKPVRFLAIDKKEKINSSQFTKFVVDEKLVLPKIDEILQGKILNLNGVQAYHDQNKDNFNRLAFVIGDVSMLSLEPTSFGSRIMVIEDTATSLEDIDGVGMTCWMPERLQIDFAEGSKVVVVGRTTQSFKKDGQGNLTEELGEVTLNTYGIYAIPEYKIAIPEGIKPIV